MERIFSSALWVVRIMTTMAELAMPRQRETPPWRSQGSVQGRILPPREKKTVVVATLTQRRIRHHIFVFYHRVFARVFFLNAFFSFLALAARCDGGRRVRRLHPRRRPPLDGR